ncbi:MAG: oxygen-independent coproporphyrinogen III oxidase [Gammaproteobacteria bacterium]|nr:oxygen-independent coproporphyrinogen III oxidase [Gammaproteobacteria bacterium]
MQQDLEFDAQLIRRYDQMGPRYTSYPTAVQFHDGFSEEDYRHWAEKSNRHATPRPLSLYFHIPFCSTVCFYCACNKVVTKNRTLAVPYLEHLYREIAAQGEMFDAQRPVDQLHWGGGTPTFLNQEQMAELMTITAEHFNLRGDDQGEYSIEIDPREADTDTVEILRQLGFNRMSLGVQDFDSRVQKAVNRIQAEEQTLEVLRAARHSGFKSVSLDLIYGLPFQNQATFSRTIERVIAADPDRISVFNYAHLPSRFKPQRRINTHDLPKPSEKLAILKSAIEQLTAAGYLYVGMDHFAKPDDELAIAQRKHQLYRNFQGYSTHADCDLVAMGITAIGSVGNSYSQNVRTLEEYYRGIEKDKIPVFRGIELNKDDLLRRRVISDLICHFYLDISAIEDQFNINFDSYFTIEISRLKGMEEELLLSLSNSEIRIRPKGRLLIRNICMVFDHYLSGNSKGTFSKVI